MVTNEVGGDIVEDRVDPLLAAMEELVKTSGAILGVQSDILVQLEDANAATDHEVQTVKVVAQTPGVATNKEFGWQEDDIMDKMYAQGWKLADSWRYQATATTGQFPTGFFHTFTFERRKSGKLDPERWLTVPSAGIFLKRPQRFVKTVLRRTDELKLPHQERMNPDTGKGEPYVRIADLIRWVDDCLGKLDAKGDRLVGS